MEAAAEGVPQGLQTLNARRVGAQVGLKITGFNWAPVVQALPGPSSPHPIGTAHVYIWFTYGYILWTYVSF